MIAARRMSGLGNRFAIIDARTTPISLDRQAIRAIAAQEPVLHPQGLHLDQIIVLEAPQRGGDVFMRIYNADGGEVGACGNATRAVAGWLFTEMPSDRLAIETAAAILIATPDGDAICIAMGHPDFAWQKIPLAEAVADAAAIDLECLTTLAPLPPHCPSGPLSCVAFGNPHAIFWVDDLPLAAPHLATIGAVLEHHPFFPQQANISFACIDNPEQITIRVWERGVGLTRACGTAACAAVAAAMRLGQVARRVSVCFAAGALTIEQENATAPLSMIGPWQDDGAVHYELRNRADQL